MPDAEIATVRLAERLSHRVEFLTAQHQSPYNAPVN